MDKAEKFHSYLSIAGSFLRHLAGRYVQDGCRESAAALTYMSLFAVVPLMTMMYAMFSIIPAFQGLGDQVQELIFNNFVPSSGAEIQEYLQKFSSQARKLSAAGAAILLVTSYLMLVNIEKTFNRIWGAASSRRGISGLLTYWGILSFGPLMVGVGLGMHTYLLSLQLVLDDVDSLGLTALILEYLPWLMTWVAFTLLFIAVPNCRVEFKPAAIGGLVTMALFETAKGLFSNLVANSSYHSVYGAFAIIPLFLLWIYLCWMIVLGGAELVRSLETFRMAYRGHRYPDLVAAVMVCWECWRRQQKGRAMTDKDVIRAGLEAQHWQQLRQLLLKKQVLVATSANRYVLTRDPSQMTLWDMVRLLGENFTSAPSAQAAKVLDRYPWYGRLICAIDATQKEAAARFNIPLSALFYEEPSDAGRWTPDA